MVRLLVRPRFSSQLSVLELARAQCPDSWRTVFEDADDEIAHASDMLDKMGTPFFPDKQNLFRAFELTPFNKIRVVIVGQDPYHDIADDGKPRATGASFMVRRGTKIPSSLQNIYREMKRSLPEFQVPTHGDLSSLAHQGILFLNSCLTVTPGAPGSHGAIWSGFLMRVISAICRAHPKCIFVMWGRKAQEIKTMLTQTVYTLESAHPSGLAANARNPFYGNNHFVRINELIAEQERKLPEEQRRGPINWQVE